MGNKVTAEEARLLGEIGFGEGLTVDNTPAKPKKVFGGIDPATRPPGVWIAVEEGLPAKREFQEDSELVAVGWLDKTESGYDVEIYNIAWVKYDRPESGPYWFPTANDKVQYWMPIGKLPKGSRK